MTEEEQVIRDWLAGQIHPDTGGPLPPARQLSKRLPHRQMVAVVDTLIRLLDEARAEAASLDSDELRKALTELAMATSNYLGLEYATGVAPSHASLRISVDKARALLSAGDKAEAPRQDFDRWTAQAGVDVEVRGEPSLRELPDGEVITDANGDELERGAGDKAEAPR